MQFYVNIFGVRNDQISKTEISTISLCLGWTSIIGILLILNILRNARTKSKRLKLAVEQIPGKQWRGIYSQIPVRILKVCCLTLTSQLLIYSLMAYQFFTRDKFMLNHATISLNDNDSQLMFQFDWVEKTVLSLVCITNTLWLPIFMYQIWELNHLIKVLEEFDS